MSKILDLFWTTLRRPTSSDSVSQVALMITVVALATLVGFLLAFFYGVTTRDFSSCKLSCRIAGGLIALVCSAGAFSMGGLLGLLFGAPGIAAGSTAAEQAGGSIEVLGDDNGRYKETQKQPLAGIRANTSLERVSGWLTTMMVGIGLANLSGIRDQATSVGIWITREITGDPYATNGTAGVVLVLWFGFAGFLLLYLWSLRFLPSELESAYWALERKIEDAKSHFRATIESMPIYRVPSATLQEYWDRMRNAEVDNETCERVRQCYLDAARSIDEPMKTFGPAEKDGYKLSATVTDDATSGLYSVSAKLTPPPGADSGECFWLLHNAFGARALQARTIDRDGAMLQDTAARAFWLGAVIPRPGHPAIRLGIDLAQAPGATEAFRKGLLANLSG